MKILSITIVLVFSTLIFFGCEEEDPLVASFTIDKSIAEIGEPVSFSNLSENSTDNIWDFGDGNATAEFSPTHIFEKLGTYTITLTAYGNGTKDISSEPIEIVPPPLNIEPGVRVGDFYLIDDLETNFAKLDESKLEYSNLILTDGEYGHIFDFPYAGIQFFISTPSEDYTLNDLPKSIEIYSPFNGWAMGGITFGSSFEDVSNVFGTPPITSGGHFYPGIIFWADNTELFVNRISVR